MAVIFQVLSLYASSVQITLPVPLLFCTYHGASSIAQRRILLAELTRLSDVSIMRPLADWQREVLTICEEKVEYLHTPGISQARGTAAYKMLVLFAAKLLSYQFKMSQATQIYKLSAFTIRTPCALNVVRSNFVPSESRVERSVCCMIPLFLWQEIPLG